MIHRLYHSTKSTTSSSSSSGQQTPNKALSAENLSPSLSEAHTFSQQQQQQPANITLTQIIACTQYLETKAAKDLGGILLVDTSSTIKQQQQVTIDKIIEQNDFAKLDNNPYLVVNILKTLLRRSDIIDRNTFQMLIMSMAIRTNENLNLFVIRTLLCSLPRDSYSALEHLFAFILRFSMDTNTSLTSVAELFTPLIFPLSEAESLAHQQQLPQQVQHQRSEDEISMVSSTPSPTMSASASASASPSLRSTSSSPSLRSTSSSSSLRTSDNNNNSTNKYKHRSRSVIIQLLNNYRTCFSRDPLTFKHTESVGQSNHIFYDTAVAIDEDASGGAWPAHYKSIKAEAIDMAIARLLVRQCLASTQRLSNIYLNSNLLKDSHIREPFNYDKYIYHNQLSLMIQFLHNCQRFSNQQQGAAAAPPHTESCIDSNIDRRRFKLKLSVEAKLSIISKHIVSMAHHIDDECPRDMIQMVGLLSDMMIEDLSSEALAPELRLAAQECLAPVAILDTTAPDSPPFGEEALQDLTARLHMLGRYLDRDLRSVAGNIAGDLDVESEQANSKLSQLAKVLRRLCRHVESLALLWMPIIEFEAQHCRPTHLYKEVYDGYSLIDAVCKEVELMLVNQKAASEDLVTIARVLNRLTKALHRYESSSSVADSMGEINGSFGGSSSIGSSIGMSISGSMGGGGDSGSSSSNSSTNSTPTTSPRKQYTSGSLSPKSTISSASSSTSTSSTSATSLSSFQFIMNKKELMIALYIQLDLLKSSLDQWRRLLHPRTPSSGVLRHHTRVSFIINALSQLPIFTRYTSHPYFTSRSLEPLSAQNRSSTKLTLLLAQKQTSLSNANVKVKNLVNVINTYLCPT
ncbi:hypothetical protein SAMD00019534_032580 [Acytostelium subglobosum LB1]|uniref:hypothetical protein n=1 Tax=Acytostelium subglobosum LB1 TaxID=1410327 RepID=UPI0006452206|nr:hypothetical protein SAMD00019534_032580 [Acytostelium subglobosum LB1]GAM20083.1 hypothetical protein SAMD00019534_032580 [Acytostelium subglobosum LB1]|eukprot:XP_012756845.1 hypothetical protein SAMD00019534_032580 [Acytostelium subglobosum LB1]